MTKDEMRVAIATDQGWKVLPRDIVQEFDITGEPPEWFSSRYHRVPNYPEDLNAIRQAVLSQRDKLGFMELFNSHLMTIVQRDYGAHLASLPLTFYMAMARAEQFSESYCHARRLWKD